MVLSNAAATKQYVFWAHSILKLSSRTTQKEMRSARIMYRARKDARCRTLMLITRKNDRLLIVRDMFQFEALKSAWIFFTEREMTLNEEN